MASSATARPSSRSRWSSVSKPTRPGPRRSWQASNPNPSPWPPSRSDWRWPRPDWRPTAPPSRSPGRTGSWPSVSAPPRRAASWACFGRRSHRPRQRVTVSPAAFPFLSPRSNASTSLPPTCVASCPRARRPNNRWSRRSLRSNSACTPPPCSATPHGSGWLRRRPTSAPRGQGPRPSPWHSTRPARVPAWPTCRQSKESWARCSTWSRSTRAMRPPSLRRPARRSTQSSWRTSSGPSRPSTPCARAGSAPRCCR